LLPAAKQQIPRAAKAALRKDNSLGIFKLHRRVGSSSGAVCTNVSFVYLRACCGYGLQLLLFGENAGVKFHDFAHVGQEIRETVVARIRVILMLHSL
jgi:hypothetical protein